MKSEEIKIKIESLADQLETAKQDFENAIAEEAGLRVGESIVRNQDGDLFRVTKVSKLTDFTSVSGHKKLKTGEFAQRESYIGILGYHGLEIVTKQARTQQP